MLIPTNVKASIKGSESLVKGGSDWRNYRPFVLDNGVTCLAINDKEAKTTAMSVCVNVGASSDPRDLSGLAHFTEHMCFLGSEKYPGENEYKKYLSSHGGRSNASTSMQYTTYKFEVLEQHAELAVDIFSNFFVQPLFTQSGTSREVNAVDSENSKNVSNDARRRLQILKAIADPNHHYSKFSTGHKGTLGHGDENAPEDDVEKVRVREAILAFHKKHYRPSNMVCVIAGPQSLDVLEDWVSSRFSLVTDRYKDVEDSKLTPIEKAIHEAAKDAPSLYRTGHKIINGDDDLSLPFQPAFSSHIQNNQWPVMLTTNPLSEMRKLCIYFPLPSDLSVVNASPITLLSFLLGHEGPNSSFAVLQDSDLAQSLSSGLRISAPDQSLFQLDVALTEKGEKEWETIVAIIFEHINLISDAVNKALAKDGDKIMKDDNDSATLQRIWGEIAQIRGIKFNYTSPAAPYDYAPTLSEKIMTHGLDNVISKGILLEEQAPLRYLADFVSRLTPENCFLERCSKKAFADKEAEHQGVNSMESSSTETKDDDIFGLKKEKWYGVDYYLSPVDKSLVESWKDASTRKVMMKDVQGTLQLPRPNRFICEKLDLCDDLPEEAKAGPSIEKEINPPELIVDSNDGLGRLWHRLDDRYALPKSSLTILLRNKSASHTWDDQQKKWVYDEIASMKTQMLTGVFSNALAQETYDSYIAGLGWSLTASAEGLVFHFEGFSERLSDFALSVLDLFFLPEDKISTSDSFLTKDSYFSAQKDQVVRSLRSYLKAGRSDAHANYYKNLLMSSQGLGVDAYLEPTESLTLAELRDHHVTLLSEKDVVVDCLYTGNISKKDATKFFEVALDKVHIGSGSEATSSLRTTNLKRVEVDQVNGKSLFSNKNWIPGSIHRKLDRGEDIELHFSSQNSQEQNGAVLVSFQSPTQGFKGDSLSSKDNLKYSAAIRLICAILREPLFDTLRTKQQLGYIVQSYHDLSFSSQQQHCLVDDDEINSYSPFITPIDSIVINIVSKNTTPQEVASRIDEFLLDFRNILQSMPKSDIKKHADSLSQKLTKPIQKLGDEAASHFAKIRRYVPEVLVHNNNKKKNHQNNDSSSITTSTTNSSPIKEIPWNSGKILASAIESLTQEDLLEVWDDIVANPNRSRIVSCVYGNTHPLKLEELENRTQQQNNDETTPTTTNNSINRETTNHHRRKTHTITSLDGIIEKRNMLRLYDRHHHSTTLATTTNNRGSPLFMSSLKRKLGTSTQQNQMIGVGMLGILSVGLVSYLWNKGGNVGSGKTRGRN